MDGYAGHTIGDIHGGLRSRLCGKRTHRWINSLRVLRRSVSSAHCICRRRVSGLHLNRLTHVNDPIRLRLVAFVAQPTNNGYQRGQACDGEADG